MGGVKVPKWAAVADAVAIIMALAALSVLIFGKFRLATFAGPLSVTDWTRPALWSLAAVIVRHVFVRQHPLPYRAAHAIRAWWTNADTRLVLPVYFATRGGVFVAGFFAVILFGFPPEANSRFRVYENAFLDLPARWDAGWYLGIARDGYRFDAAAPPERQQNIAFFPAMPILMRFVAPLLGHQTLWAGVVLSLIAFFVALRYLLWLARLELQDDGAAATAVALLAAYPFAVYFSAPYTESLFLLAMVAAVYHGRMQQWWQAAAWGLVCGLTRPNGFLLAIPLGLMALQPLWQRGWRPRLGHLLSAAAPVFGMLAFSAFIYSLTGDPFRWAAQNAAWGRNYRSLDHIVTDRVAYVWYYGFYGYASTQTVDLFYLSAVLFVLGAAWPVYRRFGLPYAAILIVNTLPPLAAGGLLSMGRLTSVLFPAFLWMAAAVPARHRTAWLLLFACLQGFVAAVFFTWRPIY